MTGLPCFLATSYTPRTDRGIFPVSIAICSWTNSASDGLSGSGRSSVEWKETVMTDLPSAFLTKNPQRNRQKPGCGARRGCEQIASKYPAPVFASEVSNWQWHPPGLTLIQAAFLVASWKLSGIPSPGILHYFLIIKPVLYQNRKPASTWSSFPLPVQYQYIIFRKAHQTKPVSDFFSKHVILHTIYCLFPFFSMDFIQWKFSVDFYSMEFSGWIFRLNFSD